MASQLTIQQEVNDIHGVIGGKFPFGRTTPETHDTPIHESTTNSKFAYVTLMHGLDESFKYRGFLYSAIIMKTLLAKYGSTADFLVMVGFSRNSVDRTIFEADFSLLRKYGIQILFLPRLLPDIDKVSFAEMALLKITPWRMVNYDRIQYFDGDIMPRKNMDAFFSLKVNSFNTGNASPLNSGWFCAVPNIDLYDYLKAKAIHRLSNPWNEEFGWNERVPKDLRFRGTNGANVKKWSFNGASLDQGLLTHTLVLNKGSVLLFDVQYATMYESKYRPHRTSLNEALKCCGAESPIEFFDHFTGLSKPWLPDKPGKRSKLDNPAVKRWLKELDNLKLEVNSSSIYQLDGKPPLDYWYPNKR
jgi:hypothetical protein